MGPNVTEIIFALGKGDQLVGRTDYCNYPPEALDVASIGPIQPPGVETIIELEPDVVIASTHGSKEAADLLANAGIEVKYFFAPQSFEGVYDVIEQVAAEIGAEAEAEALINDMSARYEKLLEQAAGIENRPSVYYVIDYGETGDWTAGGDTFIGKMIEVAGGDNIASDISGWSFSLEKLVEADPDIIFIAEARKEAFAETPVYSELSAVKSGNLYGINDDIISRQGPRLIEGIEILNEIFIK
jgi:iron complex transport system substrate-binding protein